MSAELDQLEVAPTREGISEIVGTREFSGSRTASVHARWSVEAMYEALIFEGELSTGDLLELHVPEEHYQPDQGHYTEYHAEEFFEQVARDHLEALPGVSVSEDGRMWRFDASAIDPDEFDPEQLQSVDDLRKDPEIRADRVLDELEVERRSDLREAVIDSWQSLRSSESTTAALERRISHMSPSWSEVAPLLEQLPGVERRIDHPPEPEEIEIETYRDVLDAREAVDRDPVETWTYHGG